jgi:iron complex outermembrane receptor protein
LAVNFPPTTNWSETTGVFGGLTYDISDRFNVSIEGRYQKDLVGRDRQAAPTYSASTYSFVPRITMQYHFSENVNGFVSYAEGSNPGSLNFGFLQLPDYAQQQILAQTSVPDVLPEAKLENYEVGMKGSFLDDALRVTATVYYALWTGRGSTSASLFYTTPAGVLTQANVATGTTGEAEGLGTEWEVVWAATDNLTIAGTLAYNRTKLDDSNCGGCAQITGDGNVKGNYLSRFPSDTASLVATYQHPAFRDYDAFYRIDASYHGKEYADDSNVVWLAPFVMSNARIGLRSDRYSVELYAQNIFDNEVPQSIARTTEQIAGLPTLTVTPALQRNFGVRASVRFH